MHVVLKSLPKVNIQSIFKLSPCLYVRSKRSCFKMAANGAEAKQTVEKEEEEQIVNIETVVAANNKGIDYDKLISKLKTSQVYLRNGGYGAFVGFISLTIPSLKGTCHNVNVITSGNSQ